MEEIPLGAVNSKLYEKNGELYYRISPILGQQLNFVFDEPVRKVSVSLNTENELFLKGRAFSVKFLFKPGVAGMEKVRLVPYIFRVLPFGIYFCEISQHDKRRLRDVFGNS